MAGLEIQGVPAAAAREAARGLFHDFGLDGFAEAYPYALSGGMRQRVSFARSALAARGLMLLDEPFGALDALTRTAMQEWLLRIWAHLQTTIVLVTHDVDEAVLLSDQVYVLTPRPARVAAVEPITLARPRSLASLADPAFTQAKLRLLDALRAAGGLPPEGAA